MDDAAAMRGLERLADLHRHLEQPVDRHGLAADASA